jgi:hypothetical protein
MEGVNDASEGAKNTLARKHVMIGRDTQMFNWGDKQREQHIYIHGE